MTVVTSITSLVLVLPVYSQNTLYVMKVLVPPAFQEEEKRVMVTPQGSQICPQKLLLMQNKPLLHICANPVWHVFITHKNPDLYDSAFLIKGFK